MYHDGSRCLQDRFDTRRLADRLEELQAHTEFTDEDRATIEEAPMFFLATADAEGRPDCSYKGGKRGFVRVVDAHTLAFPDYNGNGMFKSLGNVVVNPHVGLLFIDFEHPGRMRVNGIASLHEDDPLLAEYPGAQLIVRVRADQIFPNCPRYVHRMRLLELSAFVPEGGKTPPIPGWKRWDEIREVLPKSESSIGPDLRTYVKRCERHIPLFAFSLRWIRRLRATLWSWRARRRPLLPEDVSPRL